MSGEKDQFWGYVFSFRRGNAAPLQGVLVVLSDVSAKTHGTLAAFLPLDVLVEHCFCT